MVNVSFYCCSNWKNMLCSVVDPESIHNIPKSLENLTDVKLTHQDNEKSIVAYRINKTRVTRRASPL